MRSKAALQHAQHIPTLRVTTEDGDHTIPCSPDRTVHDLPASTTARVRSACGGVDAWRQCRIQIVEGPAHDPTVSELNWLTPDLIQQGIRLACQARPRHNDAESTGIGPSIVKKIVDLYGGRLG